MALMEFPFVAGLDEDTDDKVLPTPRLTSLRNMRVVRPGSVSCRAGVAQLGYGETGPTGPRRLVTFAGELLLLDDAGLFSYTDTVGFSLVEDAPKVALVNKTPLGVYSAANVVSVSAAATAQRLVHTWATHDQSVYTLHIKVEELNGGANFTPATVVAQYSNGPRIIKAVSTGTSILVAWALSNGMIYGMLVTTSTEGAWDAGDILTLASDYSSSNSGMDLTGHGSTAVLAYNSTTSGTVKLVSYNATGAVVDTASVATGGTSLKVGVVGDIGSDVHLHAVWGDDSSSYHSVYRRNSNLTSAASYSEGPSIGFDADKGIACGKYDSSSSVIIYAATNYSIVSVHNGGASPSLTSEKIFHTVPVCKPFTRDERIYFAAQTWLDQANSHSSVMSVKLEDGLWAGARIECRFNSSRAPENPPFAIAANFANPYSSASTTSATYDSAFTIPIRGLDRTSDPSLLGVTTDGRQVVSVIRADSFRFSLNSGHVGMSAELGGTLYFGGGMVSQYDGGRLTEVGFASYPDVAEPTITLSGGAMEDGSYLYALVWEWYDVAGNRHQSAPHIQTVTVDGGSGAAKVDWVIPTLSQTRKHWRLEGDDLRKITCAIYRSEADGTTLHRLEGAGSAPFLANDPFSLSSGGWSDIYSDADLVLSSREVLYTSSGGASELDNVPFPPALVLAAHQDRLFFIRAEDPREIGYSKSLRGGAGIAWNEALTVACEEPATAIGSQDGNLIIFSERSVYTVTGQGADNTGGGVNYEPPQRMSSETGCVEPRSVVTTPEGIFFRSHQGIMVLARGGFTAVHTPQIQLTLEAYPIVTAATHDPAGSRVAFAVATSEDEDASSRVLVYDYGSKLWSVYDYGDEFPIRSLAVDNRASAGATQNAGRLCWASTGVISDPHLIAREDSTFRDQFRGVSTFIPRSLETGDIRVAGLGGYTRLSHATLLGETLGAVNLQVSEYHGTETPEGTRSWAMTAESESQRRVTLVRQKASVSRFKIEQTESTAVDSEGVSLNGMSLDLQAIEGGARLRRGDY